MHQGPDGFWLDIDVPPKQVIKYHSFEIYDVKQETGNTVTFSMNDGAIFGLPIIGPDESIVANFTVDEINTRVKVDATDGVTPIPGATAPTQEGFLDNRNKGMTYSINGAIDSVIYIKISYTSDPTGLTSGWSAKLVYKTIADAKVETSASPIRVVQAAAFETFAGAEEHAGFNFPDEVLGNTTVDVNGFPGTLDLKLLQSSQQFISRLELKGVAHIPVAFIGKDDPDDLKFQFRQKLRSDVFFPYQESLKVQYIDTGIDSLTLTAGCTV